MQKNFLGCTADGKPVFDRFKTHLDAQHGVSKDIMREALSKITQASQFEKHVVKMGREIGLTSCVAVTEADEVVLAVRKGRQGPTPMVKDRKPEPCSSVVLILKKASDGNSFVLITAFVGEGSEPEPWDKQLVPGTVAHERAVKFWQAHALIYDEEVIDYIL